MTSAMAQFRALSLLLFCFFLLLEAHCQQQQAPIPSLLATIKSAYGGQVWDGLETLTAVGTKDHFGLNGGYRAVEDFGTGYFVYRSNFELLVSGEGLDPDGRWRQDHSGAVHPLNSADAKAVAIGESYLARRGYLFPSRVPAAYHLIDSGNDTAPQFDDLVATPEGGRAVDLWFDHKTHLLDHATIELSVGTKTLQYRDYRAVHGLMLPFTLSLENRDEAESGTATILSYEINDARASKDLARPVYQESDVQVSTASKIASLNAYIDQENGFLIVHASVNGRGPYPFILDTGGHDILTPQMIKQLHLSPSGMGVSTGVGAGTAETQYVTVDNLAIGAASMVRQPFTVLHLDLGSTRAEGGKSEMIAGLLGLEVFERFAVKIDYGRGLLTLTPASQFRYQGSGRRLPITFTNDEPLVAGRLDGQEGIFGVDTGNNVGLIVFRAWLKAHGLENHYPEGDKQGGMGVGGMTSMKRTSAQSFNLGGAELGRNSLFISNDSAGALAARSEAGNFGNSILKRFTVVIDYKSGFLYLE